MVIKSIKIESEKVKMLKKTKETPKPKKVLPLKQNVHIFNKFE
jgi:hypothetical protein